MTGFKKIFLDTSLFIYYLEENEEYYKKIESFLASLDDEELITSVITYEEYGVGAYRKSPQMIAAFDDFASNMGIEIIPIGRDIARKAAEIRSKNVSLKGMDALQIGTAWHTGCDLFVTNDKRLAKLDGFKFLLIDDMQE